MSNGKPNWAILIATFTFPVAAIALVLAIRAGSGKDSKKAAVRPPPMAPHRPHPPPGMGAHHRPPGPPHPGMMGHRPPHGGPPHGPPPNPAQALAKMSKQLKLTDAQIKKVQKIFKTARDRGDALKLEAKRAQRKIHELLENPNATEAQIRAALAVIHKLQAEGLQLKVLTPWRIRSVLTPEQQKKLKEISPPHPPMRPPFPR
jgi:Spy/CpxP family protein refolding chaperone